MSATLLAQSYLWLTFSRIPEMERMYLDEPVLPTRLFGMANEALQAHFVAPGQGAASRSVFDKSCCWCW